VSALIKPRLLAPMLAAVACFALAGPIVAPATASDRSIIGVVNHWSPIVVHDEKAIAASASGYKKNRKAGPVVTAYSHEVADLRAFASQIKHQSASSSAGRKGRDDVAAGLLQIAEGYKRFASEIHTAGSKGLTKKQIAADDKITQAGHDRFVAGINLLMKL
jgi:hypothetical protein